MGIGIIAITIDDGKWKMENDDQSWLDSFLKRSGTQRTKNLKAPKFMNNADFIILLGRNSSKPFIV